MKSLSALLGPEHRWGMEGDRHMFGVAVPAVPSPAEPSAHQICIISISLDRRESPARGAAQTVPILLPKILWS